MMITRYLYKTKALSTGQTTSNARSSLSRFKQYHHSQSSFLRDCRTKHQLIITTTTTTTNLNPTKP